MGGPLHREASSVAINADARRVYVTEFEGDAVDVFRRDATTGALAFVQTIRDGECGVDGLDGAAAVASGGASVYVTGGWDDTVAVFAPEPDAGLLAALARGRARRGSAARRRGCRSSQG